MRDTEETVRCISLDYPREGRQEKQVEQMLLASNSSFGKSYWQQFPVSGSMS